MIKRRRKLILLAVTGLLLFLPVLSFAGGPVHGARAAGMNTAFVAVADDPSAIQYNPAGLTLLKRTNVYGGGTFLIPSTTYTSPLGESEETGSQVFFPPHLYISSDLGTESMVFGLGLYSPFGIGGREWPKNGLTRFMSVEGFISTVSINPVVAWQITPDFSIAVGVDYMRALTRQSFALTGNSEMEIEAEGGGQGYNLGALVNLNKYFRLGLAYRSRIKVDAEGDMKVSGSIGFETDVSTTSTFPEIYSIGIAYFPNEKIVFDMDVEWVRWSSFKRSDLDFKNETFLPDTSTALDWKDSLQLKVGIEYHVSETISLRTGYAFINNPVPEHTLGPGNPDSDQHNFSIGAGYRINKWTADVFYNAGFFEDRTVNNNILSGEYENFVHYAGLSIGYCF